MAVYILDTNTISDLLRQNPLSVSYLRQAKMQNDVLVLCQPVNYEIQRGLKDKQASRQLSDYQQKFKLLFHWVSLIDDDWNSAEDLWVFAKQNGKQLSDVDLLIVALAKRLNAIIVSSDRDFNIFSLPVQNWRK
ncbi:MAG: PIN domain-containing protein [Anaerolineae bacterium]|nr:PIN domain-containing protein [Anaerolineae bacterium]